MPKTVVGPFGSDVVDVARMPLGQALAHVASLPEHEVTALLTGLAADGKHSVAGLVEATARVFSTSGITRTVLPADTA